VNARPAPPRLVAAQVAGEGSGRVLSVEAGVVAVSYRGRTVRATLGGDLLALMAGDPAEAPEVGDRVLLRTWSEGPVTVERVLDRSRPGRHRP
jgi:ribosome biogenesis GTPase / thiamine phosphate phosphatase